jgi:hypothetical protein
MCNTEGVDTIYTSYNTLSFPQNITITCDIFTIEAVTIVTCIITTYEHLGTSRAR